jgi:hypothetical protein
VKEITDPGFIRMMQDTPEGKELRNLAWKQLQEEFKYGATKGPKPANLRDHMTELLRRHSGDAGVIKWTNPDGSATYVVRKQSALVGRAARAGSMITGRFVPDDSPKVKSKGKKPKGKRGGGLIGKIIGIGVAGYVLFDTGDAWAAFQAVNPAASTTETLSSGEATVESTGKGIASDIYSWTPIATVDWLFFDVLGPQGDNIYDPELTERALQEGRNPFCYQCHGSGGALDPNNEWNLRARYESMPRLDLLPKEGDEANIEALRDWITAQPQ